MKATDYIIQFFISKGIDNIFGYPGGVICHLMDSALKSNELIKAHLNYHEQGAAFAACGYAQSSKKPGVAYATSGPGATNLITGIANAYFDSIPAIFITGQVDTYAVKGDINLRQRGFQETDVISMVKDITKCSIFVDKPDKLRYYLEKSYWIATNGRPGPVVLDIPADIQRAEIFPLEQEGYDPDCNNPKHNLNNIDKSVQLITEAIKISKRPCFLIGSGLKQSGQEGLFKNIAEKLNIPVVSSMLAFDVMPYNHNLNFGFIGANGHRYANFIIAKCDLLITLGSRLDLKQVGNKRNIFAPDAKIIRVDIDEGELSYKVKPDEVQLYSDLKDIIPALFQKIKSASYDRKDWLDICKTIQDKLLGYDDEIYNKLISEISEYVPENVDITADVGHNEVWIAQSFHIKNNQSVFMSGGHGSMGYSLPAAIGVYYGSRRQVISFCGDGGFQMNMQELQFIKRERLPIKIVVINNYSLGMIRHFQEKNFNSAYFQTTEATGYTAPDFERIAYAYDIDYYRIENVNDVKLVDFNLSKPALIEVRIPIDTYLKPNFGYNRPVHDHEPCIDRDLYNYLMEL